RGSAAALRGAKVPHGLGGMVVDLRNNRCSEPEPAERQACIRAADWPALRARARALLGVSDATGERGVLQARLLGRLRGGVTLGSPDAGRGRRGRDRQLVLWGADVLLDGAASRDLEVQLPRAEAPVRRGQALRGRDPPAQGGPPEFVEASVFVVPGVTIATPQLSRPRPSRRARVSGGTSWISRSLRHASSSTRSCGRACPRTIPRFRSRSQSR